MIKVLLSFWERWGENNEKRERKHGERGKQNWGETK